MDTPHEIWVNGEAYFDGTCSEEHPRACEVNVSLLMVKALATESGVEPVAIAEVEGREWFTEGDAAEAAQRTLARMPEGEAKDEARLWAKEGGLDRG